MATASDTEGIDAGVASAAPTRSWRVPSRTAAGKALLLVVPAALTCWLAFQSGGFLAGEAAAAAAVMLGALLLWVMVSDAPTAGLTRAGVLAIAGLGLFAAWTLASATWSGSPARAQIEFDRALLYLAALALMAAIPGGRSSARWLLRLVALALGVAVLAGLISRLQPGFNAVADSHAGQRLGWPLGYWNALGAAGAMTVVATLHLSADLREARLVRVLAAAATPALVVTIYLTLSRGAIAAGIVGLLVLLVLGFSRGMLTALAAIVPFTAYAVLKAYDADALFDLVGGDAASERQGHELTRHVAIACGGAAAVRALGLVADMRLQRLKLWRPWSLARKAATVTALAAAALAVGLAAGADDTLSRQWDRFANTPSVEVRPDQRGRLAQISANGRIEHWEVAVDGWRQEPIRGTGAGTYANTWALHRESDFSVQDAHSLYFEVLSELGIAGLALLAVGVLVPMAALVVRRGQDRLLWSGVLAVAATWAVHAGADWDWEMPALTLPAFALLGAACAGERPRIGRPVAHAGTMRLLAGLAVLLLIVTPVRVVVSQSHLEAALAAFRDGRCGESIERSLAAVEALGSRPEPFELLGFCDVRLGRTELGVRMLEAAVRRDPDSWEIHYGLALVRGAAGQDPRPDIRRAAGLNPLEPRVKRARAALRSSNRRDWARESRRLPLIVPAG
jgi:O-antigen ligase